MTAEAPARQMALAVAVALALVLAAGCRWPDQSEPVPGPATPPASPTPPTSTTPPADDWDVPDQWPSPTTTGASGDLRRIKGRTVSRDGAVLKDLSVRGTLTIRADNVTLRNVLVRADSYYGILVYGKGTVIEDSTVRGTNPDTMAGLAAIEGGTFTATRIEVTRVEDGVRLADDCVLRDSLVHDLHGDPASHFDGVTADGGFRRWQIVHNTILNPHNQTGAVWVGDARYGPSEGVLRNNYIAGGGYTVYAGPGAGAGIRVVDNVFSTRFYRFSGYWGVSTAWDPSGNTWTGNRWADGPRRGAPVQP